VRRDDICGDETLRVVVGFERLAFELVTPDAAAATQLQELFR
jgi:hypothetical protein